MATRKVRDHLALFEIAHANDARLLFAIIKVMETYSSVLQLVDKRLLCRRLRIVTGPSAPENLSQYIEHRSTITGSPCGSNAASHSLLQHAHQIMTCRSSSRCDCVTGCAWRIGH